METVNRCHHSVVNALRRLLLVEACREYIRGEQRGGRISNGLGAYMGVVLAVCGLTAWIGDAAAGRPELAVVPFSVLLGAMLLWLVWVLGVITVLKVGRVPIEQLAGREWVRLRRAWWER